MKRLFLLAALFACAYSCQAQRVSAPFGLTVNTSVNTCGAPNFNCSSESIAVITQPTQPSMPSINSTGYAYTALGDPYYPRGGKGNCYTALSDINSRGGNVSIHSSWSGGGSNVMWDPNGDFGSATDDTGALFYFHVHYDANGCMQIDSSMGATSPSGGTYAGFAMSRVTGGRGYKIAKPGNQKPGDPTTGANLYQEDLVYNPTTHAITITRTLLFDYNNCPGLDGTLTTQGGNGNLNVDYLDNRFSTSLNFPPAGLGQDQAHWVLVWDRNTNSCSTYYSGVVQNTENPYNGNIWTWCTGNCSRNGAGHKVPIVQPTYLNTVCDSAGFGVHNTAAPSNGETVGISGKCSGPTTSGNNTSWLSGTNDIQTCNNTLYNCGGHGASGFSTFYQDSSNFSFRSVSDISTWTVLRPLMPVNVDQHGGVPGFGPAGDTFPFLASSNANTLSTPCTDKAYCNELFALRLDGQIVRFGPNFYTTTGAPGELGAIPAVLQDGKCIVFMSSWGGTRGNDNGGHLRTDLFSLCNLQ